MSFTVDPIIVNAREVYPDMSATLAAKYGTQIRREIFTMVPQLRDVVEITSLAVGTRQYALNADLMSVDRVEHYTDASTFTTLMPADYDDFNKMERDFKTAANATPTSFFLLNGDSTNGPMIGVNPAPDVASTGSPAYPRLKVYGAKVDAFTAGATIYDDMPNSLVYETGICMLFAMREDPGNYSARRELYESELEKVVLYWESKNRHLPESIRK